MSTTHNHHFPAALLGALLLALCATAWGADTDDWDWGAIEAMDDTPLTADEAQRKMPTISASKRLSIEESASPDLDKPPHQAYELFPGMPSFKVVASRLDSEMHPCKSCHTWVPPVTETRKLKTPHDNFQLQHGLHGKGRFWCFTCHDTEKDRALRTLEGETLAFEDAYILCSQCHVDQARDWAYGAHGKRVGTWQGERVVYNCTACHYQHSPAFKPRTAMPGPEVRMQLPRPAHWVPASQRGEHHIRLETLWKKRANGVTEDDS